MVNIALLSKEQEDEECDATKMPWKTKAGIKNILSHA